LAHHADHIHEFTRNGKGADAPVHISVANRLTVSRFRNLMSTAAGQKFLNENLHRTSVLSSHIPTMSPRRAMQASTMGRALQGKEELPGTQSKGWPGSDVSTMGPQPPMQPTSFPLYVRLRAQVADWLVSPELGKDFVVEASARNLSARRESEARVAEQATQPAMNLRHSEDHGEYSDLHSPPASPPRRPILSSSSAATVPDEPLGEVGPDLVSKVLEHMIREVMSEDEFGMIVDKMLSQETPCYIQYENSAPPGLPQPKLPAAPEAELLQDPIEAVAPQPPTFSALYDSDGDEPTDPMLASLARGRASRIRSDLLADFEVPQSYNDAPDQGSAVSSVATPSGALRRLVTEEESVLEHPPSPSDPTAPRSWEEALAHYGEVDLDAFQDAAGEVLDRLLLDMMDDVIAGRLNWMRPLPRARSVRRR